MTIFHEEEGRRRGREEKKKNISQNGNSISVSSSCFTEDTFHKTLACEAGRRREGDDGGEGGGGKKRKTDSWRGRREGWEGGRDSALEVGFILNQNTSLFPQKSAAPVEFVQKL